MEIEMKDAEGAVRLRYTVTPDASANRHKQMLEKNLGKRATSLTRKLNKGRLHIFR